MSGIVVMRQGENALRVIERVKAKLEELRPGLPPGVKVVTAYDRSDLILASIDNLKHTLAEELAVVALVILIFLWHLPSAVIPIDDSRSRADFLRADAVDGDQCQHYVAGRNCYCSGRDGGCRHCGGGADTQEAGKRGRELEYRRLPAGDCGGSEGSGGAELFRVAGDCGFVPARIDAGSAGGAAVQTAGVHQELRHDRRGGTGHHAGPGAAAAVLPQRRLSPVAALSGLDRERRAGRQYHL